MLPKLEGEEEWGWGKGGGGRMIQLTTTISGGKVDQDGITSIGGSVGIAQKICKKKNHEIMDHTIHMKARRSYKTKHTDETHIEGVH